MMQRQPKRAVLTLFLVLANALLAWHVLTGLGPQALPAVPVGSKPTSARPAPLPPPSFSRPPLEFYRAVVERPLFSMERRPEKDAADGGVPMELSLVGVAISPEGKTALLKSKKGLTTRAPVGEWVEGWKVEEIKPDQVLLRRGHRSMPVLLERWPARPDAGGQAPK